MVVPGGSPSTSRPKNQPGGPCRSQDSPDDYPRNQTVPSMRRRWTVPYALWIIQTLLGLLFIFSGGMKFVMSVAEMTNDMPSMPGWFLHFIGVMEILGGLGLILPSLLRIRPGLTPLAAAGLRILMIGATAITLTTIRIRAPILPLHSPTPSPSPPPPPSPPP